MFGRKIDVEGEFGMLWMGIREQKLFTLDILDTLPGSLSEKTKRKLIKKTPEEIASMIREAIDTINAGSMKTIDELLREQKA